MFRALSGARRPAHQRRNGVVNFLPLATRLERTARRTAGRIRQGSNVFCSNRSAQP